MATQGIVNEPLQCGDCGGYYDPSTTPYKGVCPRCYEENKAEYDVPLQETTSRKFRDDCSYVVKDEHTFGYIFDAQPNWMGVLASKKNGHHPNGGPVSILGATVRPATAEDFAAFRVMVPPDFKNEPTASPKM